MHTGIDVSENNGHVDWARVAQAGFTFAYARATLGKESNDPTYAAHRDGARAHGLRFGGYHLPYPGNSSAEQQAEHFLSVARPRPGDLLPALDVENKTPVDKGEARFSRDELVAWLRAWLAAVERRIGTKPLLYTNGGWWNDRLQNADLTDHQLWLAHYTEREPTIPRPWSRFAIWQHSESGRVPGHPHAFDLNRCPDLDAITIGKAAGGGAVDPLLKQGARGQAVVELKLLLTAWCDTNPPPAGLVENDVFGAGTAALVKRFQRAAELDDDGKVGEKTWGALRRVAKLPKL
jgi:lysozyme